MNNNTRDKNGCAQPNGQSKFSKVRTALNISEVVKKPFVKNSNHVFRESLRVRNLSANRLINSLNIEDFARLEPYLESVSLSFGKSLYQPQDHIRYIYFPESAVISNLQMLEDGRTVEIAMTGKEGVTGLSSIFNSRSAVDWTEVIVAGNALKLNAQIFKQEFNLSTSLQSSIFIYANSYIEQISRRVICNNYHQIKERFCSWLLMLQNRNGGSKFSLTQEQIARFLGVHRPSISFVANELREKKIIDYRRGQIIILNHQALEKSTCSCLQLI